MSAPSTRFSTSSNEPVALGSRVTVPAGSGVVRFVGQTAFAPGVWTGIELDLPNGKNDGSVQDQRYFQCRPFHGVFMRSSQVRASGSSRQSSTSSTTSNASNRSKRPSTGNKRLSMPPAPQRSLDQLPNNNETGSASKRRSLVQPRTGSTPSVLGSASPRFTAASAASLGPHQVARSRKSSGSLSVASEAGSAAHDSSPGSAIPLSPDSPLRVSPAAVLSESAAKQLSSSNEPRGASPVAELENKASSALNALNDDLANQVAELRTALQAAEQKHTKDMGTVETLQRQLLHVQQTAAPLTPAVSLQELQEQLKDATNKNSDLEERLQDAIDSLEMMTLDKEVAEERTESLQHELDLMKDKLEEMTLDLEVLKGERELMGDHTMMDLDATISGATGNPENQQIPNGISVDSKKVDQLEGQNELLKEALVKLRDVSAAQEKSMKSTIQTLQSEVDSLKEYRSSKAALNKELEDAESYIAELKEALDDAIGSEEMVDELTEKNIALGDRVDKLRARVEDLEALKEVADEMESNHLATERQLQAELDYNVKAFSAAKTDLLKKDESLADYERTIRQFQALVKRLQSDIESLQAQQQSRQTNSQSLASQTQAVMRLSAQLQQSVAKSNSRAMDLELRRMDADQSRAEINLVQLYLPQSFFPGDYDSIQCLLMMRRLGSKGDLVLRYLPTNRNSNAMLSVSPSSTTITLDGDMLSPSDLTDDGGTLSSLSDIDRHRTHTILAQALEAFRNTVNVLTMDLETCSPETFRSYGSARHDFLSVESRLDVLVEGIRRLGDRDRPGNGESLEPFVNEIRRFTQQAEHVLEVHIQDAHEIVKCQLMRMLNQRGVEKVSETTAVISSFSSVLKYLEKSTSQVAGVRDIQDRILLPLEAGVQATLQKIKDSCKSIEECFDELENPRLREVGMVTGTPTDGEKASPMLSMQTTSPGETTMNVFALDLLPEFENVALQISKTGEYFEQAVGVIVDHIKQSVASVPPLEELDEILEKLTVVAFDDSHDTLPWQAAQAECSKSFTQIESLLTDRILKRENTIQIQQPGRPPWASRAKMLKSDSEVPVELQKKVVSLEETTRVYAADLRRAQQQLQNEELRIQVLERDLSVAKEEAEMEASRLKQDLQLALEERDSSRAEVERTHGELEALKNSDMVGSRSRLSLRRSLDSRHDMKEDDQSSMTEDGTELEQDLEYKTLEARIATLKRTVMILRGHNSRLKGDKFKLLLRNSVATPRGDWRRALNLGEQDDPVSEESPASNGPRVKLAATWDPSSKRDREKTEEELKGLKLRFHGLKMNYAMYCAKRRVVSLASDGDTSSTIASNVQDIPMQDVRTSAPMVRVSPLRRGWRSIRQLPEFQFQQDQLALKSLRHRVRIFHDTLPAVPSNRHEHGEELIGRLRVKTGGMSGPGGEKIKCLLQERSEALKLQELFL